MSLIALEDFIKLTSIQEDEIDESTFEIHQQGKFLSPQKALEIFLQRIGNQLVSIDTNGAILDPLFLEQTIQALKFIYEKLLQNIQSSTEYVTEANEIMQATVLALQEECQTYQNKIEELEASLQQKEEEIDFLNRKHKLMWGKLSNSSIGAKR